MNSENAKPAVLVTGVSSGIGLAIAEDLLKHGYQVFGSVRLIEDAEQLVGRWGRSFVPLVFDVTNNETLQEAVIQLSSALQGRVLKALVNNAGVSFAGPLIHQPWDEIRQTFEVNVFGLLAVTRTFLPMLQAEAGQPAGRIVNISSVSGTITVPFMATYAGSKHAVEAFTQGLRRELMPLGVHVAAIEPGFIRSRLFEKAAATKPLDRYTDTRYAAAWRTFNLSLRELESQAKPAGIVSRAVLHAVGAKKPRTRYPLDSLWYIGRYLPDRGFDRLIFKALGIERFMRSRLL